MEVLRGVRIPKERTWRFGKGEKRQFVKGYKLSEIVKYLGENAGRFENWMRGQTVTMTPNHRDTIVYARDWESFVRGMEEEN